MAAMVRERDSSDETELSRKKLKSHNEDTHVPLSHFETFIPKRVLSEDSRTKLISVEGTFKGSEGTAVVVIEKKPFNKESYQDIFNSGTTLEETFHNDIYTSYKGTLAPTTNDITTTVIHPATQKHIEKYLPQSLYMVTETPQVYKEVIEPYLAAQQFSLQWVYNILDHKKEAERIIFEDPNTDTGFVLLPDMKWDTKQLENLHVLAVCHKHGIKSIRDLRGEHLPLLRNIRDKVHETLQTNFGIGPHKLRAYLHYQPSYYHLHVHFSEITYDAPGIQAERAHLISQVISNIELLDDYYGCVALNYVVKDGTPLHTVLKKAGAIEH
ncbi:m7GpppX diphosphatase-like [Ornithodoros turicata]|uniref:m7GpppX diphosphatase-like n=1 Tax=Ornithodoros turicata TaxID=34597 RepID=UPI003138C0C2